MLTLTLIHLTETAKKLILSSFIGKMQRSNLGWTRYRQQRSCK